MGYTHFFTQLRPVTNEEWTALTTDVGRILTRVQGDGTPLAYEYNEPHLPPSITPNLIRFNGVEDDGLETFYLARESEMNVRGQPGYRFQFCKTGQKPYDSAVCAVLLAMHRNAPGAWDISSDGEIDDEGWQQAILLYAMTCEVPMEESEKVPWLIE